MIYAMGLLGLKPRATHPNGKFPNNKDILVLVLLAVIVGVVLGWLRRKYGV